MWLLLAALGVLGPPAAVAVAAPATGATQTGSLGHRISLIEKSLDLWSRMSVGWNGLRPRGAEKFLGDLGELMELDEARPRSWVLALRAATLHHDGRTSKSLQRIGAESRRLLAVELAENPSAHPWAIMDIVAWDSSGDRGESDGGNSAAWRPTTKARRILLNLLVEQRSPGLRRALLAIARRSADPLRGDAFQHLTHWAETFGPDEAVDMFLVRMLGETGTVDHGPHPLNAILERIDSSDEALSKSAQEALRERIAQLVISHDWKQAALGLRLARGLEPVNRIPILLDALTVWHKRHLSGRRFDGMVRTRGDLARAMQSVSTMKFGPEPRPWIDWWIQVQRGVHPMPGTPEAMAAAAAVKARRDAEPQSTAGFFGLKPASDRVTFVIDHSGSMDRGWGTTERTRYEEAVEQMMRFLRASPDGTQFNVILFSSEPLLSSESLVDAVPKNLERARVSLLAREPEGGTNLRPAIELALGYGRGGTFDPEAARSDTVVVLCDGATAEGAGWVAPFLKSVLPVHPVVFHSVHVGPADDGALRALAEGSGGEFASVGR